MIINCTPHVVSVYNTRDCYVYDGCLRLRAGELDSEDEFTQPICTCGLAEPICTYPASKNPARVTFVQKPVGAVDGILIYRWFTEEIVNLPDPKPNTFYIVSKMVAQAWSTREDLIFPGTLVCDAEDNVIGCIDFSRI